LVKLNLIDVICFSGTFCRFAMTQPTALDNFQGSLTHVREWDVSMMVVWVRGLHTAWGEAAAKVLLENGVRGEDVEALVGTVDDSTTHPLSGVLALTGLSEAMPGAEAREGFSRALASLLVKGYHSTVGAVKVEGALSLPIDAENGASRACSLVDFAGQMEYLVTHQLLLTSMHALYIVIQPAPSFAARPTTRSGWRYWLKYLRALGDRRTETLLLAVSQLDKVEGDELQYTAVEKGINTEFARLHSQEGAGLGDGPIFLDYGADDAENTFAIVRDRLALAAQTVAKDWYVPAAYEKLAELVRDVGVRKAASRELPLLSRRQLLDELEAAAPTVAGEGLHRLLLDPLLLDRAVAYLEAVGDVMTDRRLDCLLLDPVGWFAAFLAHFIRDDGNPPAIVKRGVVKEVDVVAALSHEYDNPGTQIPEVMALVCKLELCVPHHDTRDDDSPQDTATNAALDTTSERAYLFPCLLPAATAGDISLHWPTAHDAITATSSQDELLFRGHRFRASAGLLPPGLFPVLLARLITYLPFGTVHAKRLWSTAAVLVFPTARVLIRLDASAATVPKY
jgi:hypothetical protein